ncbi:MAG: ATP-binding cassette domain-containing protein [bacterium]
MVAKNGAGKSTLIKLLMKEIDVSDGVIERREGIRIGYLSQDTTLNEIQTVREFLFDFDTMQHREQEIELNIAINKLRIKPYLDQTI